VEVWWESLLFSWEMMMKRRSTRPVKKKNLGTVTLRFVLVDSMAVTMARVVLVGMRVEDDDDYSKH
jgi:hypothetical protein